MSLSSGPLHRANTRLAEALPKMQVNMEYGLQDLASGTMASVPLCGVLYAVLLLSILAGTWAISALRDPVKNFSNLGGILVAQLRLVLWLLVIAYLPGASAVCPQDFGRRVAPPVPQRRARAQRSERRNRGTAWLSPSMGRQENGLPDLRSLPALFSSRWLRTPSDSPIFLGG